MLDGQSAGSLCLAMAIISALKLPKVECICHCALYCFALVGSGATYNQCYPYMVNKFGKIKIAEPAPRGQELRAWPPRGRLPGGQPGSQQVAEGGPVLRQSGEGEEDSPPEGHP